jgi:hypothetical protein
MANEKDLAAVADMMGVFVSILRELQKHITDQSLQMSALLQVVFEKHPDAMASYESYLAMSRKTSPLAQTTAELIAELDGYIALAKVAAAKKD